MNESILKIASGSSIIARHHRAMGPTESRLKESTHAVLQEAKNLRSGGCRRSRSRREEAEMMGGKKGKMYRETGQKGKGAKRAIH